MDLSLVLVHEIGLVLEGLVVDLVLSVLVVLGVLFMFRLGSFALVLGCLRRGTF